MTTKAQIEPTTTEAGREQKHNAIINEYLTLKNRHPGETNNRIMVAIGKAYNMTVPGVRAILVKAGVFQK